MRIPRSPVYRRKSSCVISLEICEDRMLLNGAGLVADQLLPFRDDAVSIGHHGENTPNSAENLRNDTPDNKSVEEVRLVTDADRGHQSRRDQQVSVDHEIRDEDVRHANKSGDRGRDAKENRRRDGEHREEDPGRTREASKQNKPGLNGGGFGDDKRDSGDKRGKDERAHAQADGQLAKEADYAQDIVPQVAPKQSDEQEHEVAEPAAPTDTPTINTEAAPTAVLGDWLDGDLQAVRQVFSDIVNMLDGQDFEFVVEANTEAVDMTVGDGQAGKREVSPVLTAIPKQDGPVRVAEVPTESKPKPVSQDNDLGKRQVEKNEPGWKVSEQRSENTRQPDRAVARSESSAKDSPSAGNGSKSAATSATAHRSVPRSTTTARSSSDRSNAAPAVSTARDLVAHGSAKVAVFVPPSERTSDVVGTDGSQGEVKTVNATAAPRFVEGDGPASLSRESLAAQGTWTTSPTLESAGEVLGGATFSLSPLFAELSLALTRLELQGGFAAQGSDTLAELVPVLDLSDGYALACALEQVAELANSESVRSWLVWACGLGLAGLALEITRRQLGRSKDSDEEMIYPEFQAAGWVPEEDS